MNVKHLDRLFLLQDSTIPFSQLLYMTVKTLSSVEKERPRGLFCGSCSLIRVHRTRGVRYITVLVCQGCRQNLRSSGSGWSGCREQFFWPLKCVAWFLACLINTGAHWSCDKPPLIPLKCKNACLGKRSGMYGINRDLKFTIYIDV